MDKEKRYGRIILAVLSVSLILVVGLWKLLIWNETRAVEYEYAGNISANDYLFYIEKVKYNADMINVRGWFLKKGEDIGTAIQHVVIRDIDSGKCYKLSTKAESREDVTQSINDGHNYDMSGFNAYTDIKGIMSDSRDYELYILDENNGRNELVSLGITVRGWKDLYAENKE